MTSLRRLAIAHGLLLFGTSCGDPSPPRTPHDPPAHTQAAHGDHVVLSDDAIEAGGIEVVAAGPARIRETLALRGRLAPNEDSLSHLMPRFPGVAREVRKRLGDPVARGEVVAVIEGNQSLHPYEIRAALPGTVIARHVTVGEFVAEGATLFVVADLGSVWADFAVPREEFSRLAVGQPIRIEGGTGGPAVLATLAYLSPIGSPSSQTLLARAVVPNESGLWQPGLFVSGDVVVSDAAVAVAVPPEALHEIGGERVVFVRSSDGFEVREVSTGRRDGERAEIAGGLGAGERVAAAGSFVVKSELLKAEAEHGD
ncbi:Cobalt-zinc-cadmium resistance protein CzcB [Myxococcaceae bacterium]|nr:Cobalt-zinc-cadmium resistance protein CzcB [Myxococcaceae bacterium]